MLIPLHAPRTIMGGTAGPVEVQTCGYSRRRQRSGEVSAASQEVCRLHPPQYGRLRQDKYPNGSNRMDRDWPPSTTIVLLTC